MKLIDRLGWAFAITTLSLLSCLVWGAWYVIAYYTSPTCFRWCLWLIPPVVFVAMFIGLTLSYRKGETER